MAFSGLSISVPSVYPSVQFNDNIKSEGLGTHRIESASRKEMAAHFRMGHLHDLFFSPREWEEKRKRTATLLMIYPRGTTTARKQTETGG